MKVLFVPSVLLYYSAVLLFLRTSSHQVLADECTDADFASFSSILSEEAFNRSCGGVVAAASITAVDIHSLDTLDPCGDDTCVAYLKAIAVASPPCESDGVSISKLFDALASLCSFKPTKLPTATNATNANKTKSPLEGIFVPTTAPKLPVPVSVSNTTASESESETNSDSAAPATRALPTTARPMATKPAASGAAAVKSVAVAAGVVVLVGMLGVL